MRLPVERSVCPQNTFKSLCFIASPSRNSQCNKKPEKRVPGIFMKPNVHVRKLIFSEVSKARCTLLLIITQLK